VLQRFDQALYIAPWKDQSEIMPGIGKILRIGAPFPGSFGH
jgi:hypothetical protein